MKSVLSLPIVVDMTKTKMAFPSALFLTFICFSSANVQLVEAQFGNSYNCDKYCHASCQDYFPGAEFSACVSANVHCPCHTSISAKNPVVVIFIMVTIFFMIAICCGVCCRIFNTLNTGSRPNSHRTIARPITTAVPVSVSNNWRSSNAATSNTNSNRPSQRNLSGYINPLGPQKSNDIPPEYLPPPAYNECVIDINPQEKTEKPCT